MPNYSEGNVAKKKWLPQQVQRWVAGDSLCKDDDGNFVKYRDYAALEAENQKYREALEKIIQNHMDLPLSGRGHCLELAQKALEEK